MRVEKEDLLRVIAAGVVVVVVARARTGWRRRHRSGGGLAGILSAFSLEGFISCGGERCGGWEVVVESTGKPNWRFVSVLRLGRVSRKRVLP